MADPIGGQGLSNTGTGGGLPARWPPSTNARCQSRSARVSIEAKSPFSGDVGRQRDLIAGGVDREPRRHIVTAQGRTLHQKFGLVVPVHAA